jgi:AraC-like DNA-binding protein
VQSRPRTAERELERVRAARDELAERIARHVAKDGSLEAAPGFFLSRSSAPSGPVYRVLEPCFCVIAQGSKEMFLGHERYRYDASQYLLVSAGLPLVGRTIAASKERPYLGLRLVLDPAVVTGVLIEAGRGVSQTNTGVKALAVSRLDANMLDSVVRLVRLLDTPRDYAALAPLAVREIVYRLSQGEQSGRLRQIAVIGRHARRMTKAIELLRKDYDKPLRIPGLARQLGMSVSGFHHHFKAVTAMSPLQFQKQLRLQEARRLLLAGDFDAATAGYRVGYDDPSHFSREYKRHFGEPPMRDVDRLRAAASSHRGAIRVAAIR